MDKWFPKNQCMVGINIVWWKINYPLSPNNQHMIDMNMILGFLDPVILFSSNFMSPGAHYSVIDSGISLSPVINTGTSTTIFYSIKSYKFQS